MAIASPRRGEVGGGNCVGSDFAIARHRKACVSVWSMNTTPYFLLSIARIDPLPHQLEAVYDYFLNNSLYPVPPGG